MHNGIDKYIYIYIYIYEMLLLHGINKLLVNLNCECQNDIGLVMHG